MLLIVLWPVIALVNGCVGYAIGRSKGRGTGGFWLGFFVGAIGWVIIAVLEPTEAVRRERALELAAALSANPTLAGEGTRDCPWCAERIKTAAKVCRYCGHEVPAVDPQLVEQQLVAQVRTDYPKEFPVAEHHLLGLEVSPEYPDRWLRELCKRISAGSPPEAAAARIPLDWAAPVQPALRAEPRSTADRHSSENPATDGLSAIRADFPKQFEAAQSVMASLADPPVYPNQWLRELCKRMDAGSPPTAAASRIPLDFGGVQE